VFQNGLPKLFVPLPDWGRTYAARAYDIGEDGTSSRMHSLTGFRGSVANCRHLGKQDSACCMYRAVYQVAGLLSLHDIYLVCEQIGRNKPKSRINFLRSMGCLPGMVHQRVGRCPASGSLQIIISRAEICGRFTLTLAAGCRWRIHGCCCGACATASSDRATRAAVWARGLPRF
jgi:hypothetical protein